MVLSGGNIHFPREHVEMHRGVLGCHNDGVTSLDAKYPTMWRLVLVNPELNTLQS